MEYLQQRPAELAASVMYEILRLRTDVFVVEQECAYPELDGRDLEPDCLWWWATDDGTVLATLRVLREPANTGRIGRVATAASARGRGLAADLMARAITTCRERGDSTVVLDAQTVMLDWYARLGFTPSGPEFLDDGILHTPMALHLR